MKTLPGPLAADYAAAESTLCTCLLITRQDGVNLRFTSVDIDVVIAGQTTGSGVVLDGTYGAAAGLDVTGLASSAGLSVDNLELQVLPDGVTLIDADLLAGLWNNARFVLFECNFLAPSNGVNVLKRGTTGEAQVMRGRWVIELRGLKQALQQNVGGVVSKTCRARLGDAACTKVLTSFTFTTTVTTATSRQVFTASALVQAADYFGDGKLTWLTGANAGYSAKVKSFAAGVVTLSLPAPFAVAASDQFTIVAGCRKRLEDCVTKFANVVNFQGEPHVPGVDAITRPPDTSA